ncbi:hypothetical protein [Nitrosomonas sp.]|uniref:hypothetical protein n=1 Tax=Nitrosomonas sp. TaxID=42353 RepID=UPI0035227A58
MFVFSYRRVNCASARKSALSGSGFIAIAGIIAAPIGIWLAQKLPNAPLALFMDLLAVRPGIGIFRSCTGFLSGLFLQPLSAG